MQSQSPSYSSLTSTDFSSVGNDEYQHIPFLDRLQKPDDYDENLIRRSGRRSIFTLLFAFLLFVASVVLFLLSYMRRPSDMECSVQLSTYSPMMKAVEYEQRNFVNDFRQPSIYRGEPNPEREKAWDELWNYGDIDFPSDKIYTLNKSADVEWRRTKAGGPEVAIEVFHQIHCLNMIRQYTYRDHYDVLPEDLADSAKMVRMHVDHCIESIRMELMCAGDVTVIPIRIDPTSPFGSRADFSTHHKCRKFDRLRDWVQENVAVPRTSEEGVDLEDKVMKSRE